MRPLESNQFPYTYAEWMDHFRAASEASQVVGVDIPAWSDSYFRKYYPDAKEAHYKKERLLVALSFWEENARGFDFDKVTVVGDKLALVSGAMAYALHAYFASMPDRQLGRVFPPVKDVRDMAQSIALKYAEE